MPERWRRVPAFSDYEVSDQGRVRSHKAWRGIPTPRLVKTFPNVQTGYPQFRATDDADRQHTVSIHQWVLLAFVGPRPDGMEIRHLDGDRQHNALSNLCYGTGSENGVDQILHGTHPWASRTACSKGHDYTPENTRWYRRRNGHTFRQCVICKVASNRRAKAKMRAKARALAHQPRAA